MSARVRLREIAREAAPPPGGELPFVSWADLQAAAPPEPPWVLGGYLAHGTTTMLAGKPKSGKSTLACAIAEAVDAGAPSFLGRAVGGGPVVYLSEEGASTLAPKLSASSRSSALARDAVWPKPAWAPLVAGAVSEAKRIGAVLLVIDSLSFWAAFGEGQEKDAGKAQEAMDALGEATRAGLSVLLVHHQRKAGGEDGDAVRGSGAIFAAVDVLIELERTGEDAPPGQRRLVAVGRWRDLVPPVLVVDRDPAMGAWAVVGEAASRKGAAGLGFRERILAALPAEAPGATEGDLAALIGVDKRKISGPLRELVREGLVAQAGEGVKGTPYLYAKNAAPECCPDAGAESPLQMLPAPLGEGQQQQKPHLAPGAARAASVPDRPNRTLEDELLDPGGSRSLTRFGGWRVGGGPPERPAPSGLGLQRGRGRGADRTPPCPRHDAPRRQRGAVSDLPRIGLTAARLPRASG